MSTVNGAPFGVMKTDFTDTKKYEDGFHHVAAVDIPKGGFICTVDGPIRSDRTRYTMQTSLDKHTDPWNPLRYTNHSCDPTAKLQYSSEPWRLVVVRDIKKGEDITFDYNTFEYKMAEEFNCACGAKCCRGKIQGFHYLSDNEKNELADDISPVVKKLWQSEQ